MTHSDNRADCLERARMHDRLADTTNDAAARQMHQAMAAALRHRAGQMESEEMPAPASRPVMELYQTIG